jgi:putative transposase
MGSNFALKPGSEVDYGERRFAIMQVISFETVVARDVETGELERLPIAGLRSISEAEPPVPPPDLSELDDRDWNEARRRLDLIQPVLDAARLPRSVMSERARDAGVEVTTLYRWARLYRATGLLSSLLPYKRGGGRGKSRLEPAVEQIVLQTIEEHFLTRQQRTIQSTAAEVARRCREAQLSVPHAGTIRARIIALPVRERLGAPVAWESAARDRFEPRPGSLDEAQRPLDFVQIDHTKLDVIVVDEQQRLPIGRPWITLAIDVYSRMVLGFYISLDPPGAIATGQCIAHAALPKETWLAKRGIVGSWPCWGFPVRVHLDNAKEFHGEMLRRACEQYGIVLEYRPVAQPHLGGHIERLLGTLLRALHELPGATFSNPGERGNYDSQARAVMTLGELERWLTEYIVGVYHAKRHRGIGTSPLQRWTSGVFGDAHDGGTGVIDRPANEERIRLDFLPFVERTVQAYGISIDGIHYYSDVLRRFVGATENGRRRVFVFRRDPRDISTVSFWDPGFCRVKGRPSESRPALSPLSERSGRCYSASM